MANKARGERSIKGDETYTIVFNSNAIAQAEEQLGYGVGVAMGNYMTGAFSIRETIILLWAALLKYHGPLSTADAGEILDEVLHKGKNLGEVFEALMEALNDALPFKGEGEDPKLAKTALVEGNRKKSPTKSGGQGSSKPEPVAG
jgi:hypothetical protein